MTNFGSIYHVFREYNDIKEEIKKSWNFCGVYYLKTMETYCVSRKENSANENSRVWKTKQNRLMLLSDCAACGKKKLTFIKNKNLTIIQIMSLKWINKFLLIRDNFMQELHLKQPGFTGGACGPLTKHPEKT